MGQNCYISFPTADVEHAVKIWYDEGKNYKFNKPGWGKEHGHWSQLVWAGTTSVGIGQSANKQYIVANFHPQGNINSKEEYKKNVFPVGGKDAKPPSDDTCFGMCSIQ